MDAVGYYARLRRELPLAAALAVLGRHRGIITQVYHPSDDVVQDLLNNNLIFPNGDLTPFGLEFAEWIEDWWNNEEEAKHE